MNNLLKIRYKTIIIAAIGVSLLHDPMVIFGVIFLIWANNMDLKKDD